MKIKYPFLIATLVIGFSCTNPTEKSYTIEEIEAETNKINTFFQNYFDDQVDRFPTFQARLGIKKDQGKWDNISEEFNANELEVAKAALNWIKDSINYKALSNQAKTSFDLFVAKRENQLADYKYRYHGYPINQMFGWHTYVPNLLINMHQIQSREDADAYISRLNGVPVLFDQLVQDLKEREENGIVPPKFVFARVIDDCNNIISGIPILDNASNTIMVDFSKKIETLDITSDDQEELLSNASSALEKNVKPAYESLISFLQAQESRATDEAGVWKFPEGEAYYKNALNRTTTTQLTAEDIHEIGLNEVTRIHDEMKKIMEKVGFEGDLQAFFTFLKEDDQFYYPNTDAGKELYMDSATIIINNMKGRLDELFNAKPKADMVVKRVESFREKSAGKAFYQRPSLDGSRPGTYYANLYDSKNMPKFEMEALAYHEGIPGHHMQLSIAQELEGIPDFRKHDRYTAYSEGWGLYCELLPKEIGLYENPYSDYGRLAMELWRACRLVVDTGIHTKKWSREDGIAYYMENTSGTERECVRMVERHIVMPSQATAYKIGMMKILELREGAKSKLGEKFDIREFHDVVLTSGLVPLHLLEKMVNEWVDSKASA